MSGISIHATREADSGRVAMAREYIDALVSHDATKLRLGQACLRVENGKNTGDTGQFISNDLEQGQQYRPISGVRDVRFREWGTSVVARYLLDLDGGMTVAVTEHFEIPAGDITAITAVIEPG